MAWDDEPRWRPPEFPRVEEALSAQAVVVHESGRWIVYLDVVLTSGAVRRRVGDHHDERRALHAARIIERNANRGLRVLPDCATMTDQPADRRTDDKD